MFIAELIPRCHQCLCLRPNRPWLQRIPPAHQERLRLLGTQDPIREYRSNPNYLAMWLWGYLAMWPCGLANRLKLNPSQRTNYGHHSGSSCRHRRSVCSRDLSPHLSPRVLWLNSINAARHAAECRPKMMAPFRIGEGLWLWQLKMTGS